MVRTPFLVLICFISLILHGQGSQKTITLSSGEAVWDLNGEWDAFIENYGYFKRYGTYPNVFEITQKGSSFTGVRMKDNPPPSTGGAGSNCLRGELDKNGFKTLVVIGSGGDIIPSKGYISEDGNKISIDAPDYARVTLTRK